MRKRKISSFQGFKVRTNFEARSLSKVNNLQNLKRKPRKGNILTKLKPATI